jgi:hypothetical protein
MWYGGVTDQFFFIIGAGWWQSVGFNACVTTTGARGPGTD